MRDGGRNTGHGSICSNYLILGIWSIFSSDIFHSMACLPACMNDVRLSVYRRDNTHTCMYQQNLMCVRMCVLVCVAPPMVVGEWSMAGPLRQLFEYYYYYRYYRRCLWYVDNVITGLTHKLLPLRIWTAHRPH